MNKCELCGKNVNITKGNCIITTTGYRHKKCPVEKLSDKDKKAYKDLTNCILKCWTDRPRGYYEFGKSLNWTSLTSQIKRLVDEGYSYEDIQYAMEISYHELDGFWGFNQVTNRIKSIIERRNKYDIVKDNIKDVEYQDEDITFDLGKLKDGDDEWL